MKFFTITFSIYVLILSMLPCGDISDCNDLKEANISATSNDDNHKHEKETCSPFCICSCCGSSVLNIYNLASFSDIAQVYVKIIPFYKETFISVVYFHIWQPPKIS